MSIFLIFADWETGTEAVILKSLWLSVQIMGAVCLLAELWPTTDMTALFFFSNLSHQPRGLCKSHPVAPHSWLPIILKNKKIHYKTKRNHFLLTAYRHPSTAFLPAFSLKSNLFTISDLTLHASPTAAAVLGICHHNAITIPFTIFPMLCLLFL